MKPPTGLEALPVILEAFAHGVVLAAPFVAVALVVFVAAWARIERAGR